MICVIFQRWIGIEFVMAGCSTHMSFGKKSLAAYVSWFKRFFRVLPTSWVGWNASKPTKNAVCCLIDPQLFFFSLGKVFLEVAPITDRTLDIVGYLCLSSLRSYYDVKRVGDTPRVTIREFRIWRRQRQRQRHKLMILLVEWRKIIVLHVRHAFWCNVLT